MNWESFRCWDSVSFSKDFAFGEGTTKGTKDHGGHNGNLFGPSIFHVTFQLRSDQGTKGCLRQHTFELRNYRAAEFDSDPKLQL